MRVIHLPRPQISEQKYTRGTQEECLALCKHMESMILQYHKYLAILRWTSLVTFLIQIPLKIPINKTL